MFWQEVFTYYFLTMILKQWTFFSRKDEKLQNKLFMHVKILQIKAS